MQTKLKEVSLHPLKRRRASVSRFTSHFLYLIFCVLLLASCDTNDPPPPGNGNGKPKPKITLTVDDASPTEVWLNVTTENIPLPDTLKLLRNNVTVQTIQLYDSSYVIYEDSLLPSQSYSYSIVINDTVTSEATTVTMDTTSHNFSYEIFEFGEHGNSVLRDVAIIDENNIWAVGAIYLNDSTGQRDPHAYNAVHWNGNEWKIKRIRYYGDCSAVEYPPLYSVYAFSSEKIVLTNGGSIGWYDGESLTLDCGVNSLLTGAINQIWGTSGSNLYVVGGNGSIAHYNGTSWSKIESGTEVDLLDVWGQGNIVWVSGYEETGETVLIKIVNKTAEIVFSEIVINNPSQFNGTIRSLWTNTEKHLYILSSTNLYRYSNGLDNKIKPITEFGERRAWYERIRGNDVNDIFIAGYKSSVQHYNGNTWQEYPELQDEFKITFGLDYKDNIVVVVGEDYRSGFFSKGFITIGKRQFQ